MPVKTIGRMVNYREPEVNYILCSRSMSSFDDDNKEYKNKFEDVEYRALFGDAALSSSTL